MTTWKPQLKRLRPEAESSPFEQYEPEDEDASSAALSRGKIKALCSAFKDCLSNDIQECPLFYKMELMQSMGAFMQLTHESVAANLCLALADVFETRFATDPSAHAHLTNEMMKRAYLNLVLAEGFHERELENKDKVKVSQALSQGEALKDGEALKEAEALHEAEPVPKEGEPVSKDGEAMSKDGEPACEEVECASEEKKETKKIAPVCKSLPSQKRLIARLKKAQAHTRKRRAEARSHQQEEEKDCSPTEESKVEAKNLSHLRSVDELVEDFKRAQKWRHLGANEVRRTCAMAQEMLFAASERVRESQLSDPTRTVTTALLTAKSRAIYAALAEVRNEMVQESRFVSTLADQFLGFCVKWLLKK